MIRYIFGGVFISSYVERLTIPVIHAVIQPRKKYFYKLFYWNVGKL
jgi:hypothetical protein